jgi:DNA-binding MarR family transcriptional regulator
MMTERRPAGNEDTDTLPRSGNRGRVRTAVHNDLVNPMDRFVGYKIRRLKHSIINELNEILRAFDIRIMDFAILCIVDANPGLYQNGITRLLGAEPPAVVLALDRLERAGGLTRQANMDDRRLRTLHLTAAGKKLLKKVTTRVDQQENRIKQAAGRNLPALVSALDDLMKVYGLR